MTSSILFTFNKMSRNNNLTFSPCISTSENRPLFPTSHDNSARNRKRKINTIRNFRNGRNSFGRLNTVSNNPSAASPSILSQKPAVSGTVEPTKALQCILYTPVSEWVCAICQEGATSNPNIVQHACGRHSYHFDCISDVRNTDPRCALCRQPNHIIDAVQGDNMSSQMRPPASRAPTPLNSLNLIPSTTPTAGSRTSVLGTYTIFPKYIRRISDYPEICCNCREDIAAQTNHSCILPCQHPIHDNCLLDVMLQCGFNENGYITCTLCCC